MIVTITTHKTTAVQRVMTDPPLHIGIAIATKQIIYTGRGMPPPGMVKPGKGGVVYISGPLAERLYTALTGHEFGAAPETDIKAGLAAIDDTLAHGGLLLSPIQYAAVRNLLIERDYFEPGLGSVRLDAAGRPDLSPLPRVPMPEVSL